jgi:excinuclease ABC subunit A
MHFLPDVWVECEACKGRRYNEDTLAVRYNGRTIDDVLKMPCSAALEHFSNIPKIRRILKTLCDVGLDYVTLGQSAPTLSGGEAQRVKLSAELARPDTGRTLYLLDEPTTGLHFNDLEKLLEVIQRLVDVGNTVVLIEHNLDIIKAADWVIDMGPEAGIDGGQVVIQGTPETVAAYAKAALGETISAPKKKASKKKTATKVTKKTKPKKTGLPRSYTGEALISVLEEGPYKKRKAYDPSKDDRWKKGDMDIEDVGANAQMPWEADGRRWHTLDRVGRGGEPVKWDGRVLDEVVSRIEQHDNFSDTVWNQRTVVEVAGEKKSQGWFFHAVTGDAWFVTLKFRVRPRAFKREELIEAIPLRTANQMEDLPVYGNKPRVKITNTKASWQEVEIKVHSWNEINTPSFWNFVENAIASFQNKMQRVDAKIEDQAPWAKLGEKWHLMPKGFPPNSKPKWDVAVLEQFRDLLQELAPKGDFEWTNKQVVHFNLPGQKKPWVTIQTKKPDALWIQVAGPKGSLTLGQVADFANQATATTSKDQDSLKMCLIETDDVKSDELRAFLHDHLESMMTEAT